MRLRGHLPSLGESMPSRHAREGALALESAGLAEVKER